MTFLLMQKHGDKLRPVAHYSARLDTVSGALPPCLQAVVAAAALAVEMSATLVLFMPLTLRAPHAGSVLLHKHANMSPAKHS